MIHSKLFWHHSPQQRISIDWTEKSAVSTSWQPITWFFVSTTKHNEHISNEWRDYVTISILIETWATKPLAFDQVMQWQATNSYWTASVSSWQWQVIAWLLNELQNICKDALVKTTGVPTPPRQRRSRHGHDSAASEWPYCRHWTWFDEPRQTKVVISTWKSSIRHSMRYRIWTSFEQCSLKWDESEQWKWAKSQQQRRVSMRRSSRQVNGLAMTGQRVWQMPSREDTRHQKERSKPDVEHCNTRFRSEEISISALRSRRIYSTIRPNRIWRWITFSRCWIRRSRLCNRRLRLEETFRWSSADWESLEEGLSESPGSIWFSSWFITK